MISSTDHVRILVDSGKFETMADMGRTVGITTERVRQIIKDHDIHWVPTRGRLEWDCPGCGTPISIRRSEKKVLYWPAHCQSCRVELTKKFYRVCKHPKTPENTTGQGCRICVHSRAHCIVETRECMACGDPLEISRGAAAQIRNGHSIGMFHWDCYITLPKNGIRGGTQSHCGWGHKMSGDNLRHYGKDKARVCGACAKRRSRKSYKKLKEEREIRKWRRD